MQLFDCQYIVPDNKGMQIISEIKINVNLFSQFPSYLVYALGNTDCTGSAYLNTAAAQLDELQGITPGLYTAIALKWDNHSFCINSVTVRISKP